MTQLLHFAAVMVTTPSQSDLQQRQQWLSRTDLRADALAPLPNLPHAHPVIPVAVRPLVPAAQHSKR